MTVKININKINLSNWEIFEKKRGNKTNRIIYINKEKTLFMKIWDNDYIYKTNFTNAYNVGYYNNISLLKNIIINNDDITGYITYKLSNHNLECGLNAIKNQNILLDNNNNKQYIYFINNLIKNTIKFKLVHIDVTPYNIGINSNKYYIFDLESVLNISELKNMTSWKYYNPKSYVSVVEKI